MIETTEISITYQGDGTQTKFSYPYPYRKSSDIVGYIVDGEEHEEKITTNYKYDATTNEYIYPVSGDPLQSPLKLKLIRETPQQQNADLPNKLPFSLIEKSMDWIIMILQEIGGKTNSIWNIKQDCTAIAGKVLEYKNNAATSAENAAASSEKSGEFAAAAKTSQTNAKASEEAALTAKTAIETLVSGVEEKLQKLVENGKTAITTIVTTAKAELNALINDANTAATKATTAAGNANAAATAAINAAKTAEQARTSAGESAVTAKTNADKATAEAKKASTSASSVATAATKATTEANRATTEANRAKTEADRAASVVGGNYLSIDKDTTITGKITFSKSPIVPAPITDTDATTKKYVDDKVGGISIPSNYLSLDAGGTVNGKTTFTQNVTLNGTPTADNDSVNKKYVDNTTQDLSNYIKNNVVPKVTVEGNTIAFGSVKIGVD